MFAFKRRQAISDSDLDELKIFLSSTLEKMLLTRDETLNTLKKYDLVLISSWEGSYLVADIFQLSKFNLTDGRAERGKNVPFYTIARSFTRKNDLIVYLDEHQNKCMRLKNLLAFRHTCYLLQTVDIEVLSERKYTCTW
ncbi:hypothetical protein BBH88_02070 [Planococcus antarcticus DSM 14505]|uniref:Uncharacterized protein n=1 Tax=Planococcus antarcticus DSM 14505 TaxID=1185653 RepID=A0ABN4RAY2_9BACL|nr:hypothetical protein [Planococcus antarcticus]ANU09204.1 hypothetical protein BBH88_02070 [Planococcus antarcticus DSM 14505]